MLIENGQLTIVTEKLLCDGATGRFDQPEMDMKYLLLIYTDAQQLAALSPSDRSLVAEAGRSNEEWLRASGRLLAGAQLQAGSAVTTVCVQQTAITLAAGPLQETERQLSAFYLIAVRDLNEAIQVATQLGQASYSVIEVRPLAE